MIADRFYPVNVDVTSDDYRDFRAKPRVVPTIIIVNDDPSFMATREGYASPKLLRSWLEWTLSSIDQAPSN